MTAAINVVTAYRQRKFRDLGRTWKALKRAELDAIVERLEPKPEFVHSPFDHQLAVFLLALKYPGLLIALDMGTGKSKIVLDVFSYRRRLQSPDQRARRMLVLVPNRSNVWGWEEQIQNHAPWLTYGLLSDKTASQARRDIWYDTSLNVVVATYQGLVALHKRNNEIDPKLVTKTGAIFDTIVADESSALRNHDSQAFRILSQLAHLVRFRYPMTGTPFTKDPLGLWSQLYFADPVHTPLTSSFGVFRSLFFVEFKTAFKLTYALAADKRDTLNRVIRHLAIRYEEKECNSLPEKMGGLANPICIPIHLHAQQQEYVRQTFQQVQEAARNETILAGAFNRLRRAASGYMEIAGTGEFREFDENPKMEACIDLLREMGSEQCIVVAYYRQTVRLIEQRLALEDGKAGGQSFKCSKIVGGQSDSERQEADFRTGRSRIMLLSTAGAYGLNLQHCRYMIIFESPIKGDDALQVEKRIHRTGQTLRVTIYHLVAPIDAKILTSLRDNKKVLDYVMDGETDIV
jgi:SNF2 family DNA or RNA helicase